MLWIGAANNMITAIIQARMSSTRLPGKVLKKIKGKTLLEILVERLRYSKKIDRIIIATSDNNKDKAIIKLAKKIKCAYFVGDEEDVLDRFYQAAKKFKADTIIRITGDCPLHDPRLIDEMIGYYLKNKRKYDYVSNVNPPSFPDGLDLWIFSFKTLERAWQEAKLKSEREHVCPYIWKNPRLFKIGHFKSKTDYSHWRWTVDDATDFKFVKDVYEKLYKKGKIFYMEDVADLLNKNPSIHKIQDNKIRDAGYLKSIKEDKRIFKNIKINGKRIFLRKLNENDATKEYCGWLNDKEVNRYLVNSFREGERATIKKIKLYIREKNKNPNSLLLGIFFKNNKKHIGNIKLEPIDFANKKAMIGILIGEKNYWGKGLGTEATRQVVNYAFKELKLKELNLGVLPGHRSAIRVYEKNGFKFDHIEKKSIKIGNKFYDNLIMSLRNKNK